MKRDLRLSLGFVFLSTVMLAQSSADRAAVDVATKTIRPDEIRAHIRFLSDSLLTGRAPGTPGYDISARYVATELEGMGLHPGVSGGWFQTVPLEKAVTDAAASSLVLTMDGKEQKLADAKDYILSTWFASRAGKDSAKAQSDVSAPVVFVGFGVTAPDQKYDDYAGVDAKGKIVAEIYGAPATFPSTERAYYSDGVVKARNAVARSHRYHRDRAPRRLEALCVGLACPPDSDGRDALAG
jgi:hypothetical protein